MAPRIDGPQLARGRITQPRYRELVETGVLGEDLRVELLDGELVPMATIGSRHAAVVRRLNRWFVLHGHPRVTVDVQNPLVLDDHSEPEPDLLLLRPRADDYLDELPRPEDVLLLVEVCDSTGPTDRGRKLPLYARAGVTEVWLVDLDADRVDVHREPGPAGYASVRPLRRGDRLQVAALPDLELPVDEVLPPSP